MWLQRTEIWQIFLHQRGASVARVDGAGDLISNDVRQVAAESALDAWHALMALLPPRCRLQVYLDADLARLALVSGGDDLSERDWQSLAEASFSDSSSTVVIDTRWRSGKRGALAVDTVLLEAIKDGGHALQVVGSSAVAMLSLGQARLAERPTILQVRDGMGWTIAILDKKTCLSLCSYPATATAGQVETEGKRMATAAGLASDSKRVVIATPPSVMPLQLRSLFGFDLLRRQWFAKIWAMLGLIVFLSQAIALTHAWHGVGEQASAVSFKQLRLKELMEVTRLQQMPKLDAVLANFPAEQATDWNNLFGELQVIAVPSEGMQATSLSAQVAENRVQLAINVRPEALDMLYERLRMHTGNTWRVASINKVSGDSSLGYQVLLIKQALKSHDENFGVGQ